MLNFNPQLWPHSTFRDHDFHNFESTLPEDAFIKVSAFLGRWFLKKSFGKFLKMFSIIPCYLPLTLVFNVRNFEFPCLRVLWVKFG